MWHYVFGSLLLRLEEGIFSGWHRIPPTPWVDRLSVEEIASSSRSKLLPQVAQIERA